ncbi:hypothetical protein HJG60_007935 [Phyllostomus discolor]|uniref:Uncharacterized protein n=1 Tax=Phyllostomus discolor TaxID=89673 RepID=A0A834BJT7_9CHIR|nr:hypothetical protein HJG60_007935 [Phyllostomus discolor]
MQLPLALQGSALGGREPMPEGVPVGSWTSLRMDACRACTPLVLTLVIQTSSRSPSSPTSKAWPIAWPKAEWVLPSRNPARWPVVSQGWDSCVPLVSSLSISLGPSVPLLGNGQNIIPITNSHVLGTHRGIGCGDLMGSWLEMGSWDQRDKMAQGPGYSHKA